jgi:Peptidase family S41
VIFTRREIVGGAAALAGVAVAPRLSAGEVDDAALLRRALTLLHPGLLRYQTARQMDANFDTFEQAWRANDDRKHRYLALSRLLGTIKCGHSYGNFYNQKDEVAAELFGGRDKLPFRFRWIGNAMVVTGDATGTLAAGSVVQTIDGRPVKAILDALLPMTRADGSNDAKRRQLLSVIGNDQYETFDCYYPLLFPVNGSFRIIGRDPSGHDFALTLPAIDRSTRQQQRAKPTDGDGPQWTLAHDARTATLKMDNWGLYNSKWDWKAWLDQAFEDMTRRQTQRLIVDIRRNEGGLDCGHEIIARLIDDPLPLNAYARRVRYRRVPDDLMSHLDTWDPSFSDWGQDAEPFDARFLTLTGNEDGVAEIKPKGPRFRGNVVVLTSAENSSATFQFADLVQQNRLGRLMGEPTGGNRRGINGGAFFFLRLPQSGLEADLPLIGTFPKTPQPDAGLRPDIIVPVRASDIATGRDTAMERALTV